MSEHNAMVRRLHATEDAIRLVRVLHVANQTETGCHHCGWGWPCPTIKALEEVGDA